MPSHRTAETARFGARRRPRSRRGNELPPHQQRSLPGSGYTTGLGPARVRAAPGASLFAQAPAPTRLGVVERLQSDRGNAHVQRLLGSLRLQREAEDSKLARVDTDGHTTTTTSAAANLGKKKSFDVGHKTVVETREGHEEESSHTGGIKDGKAYYNGSRKWGTGKQGHEVTGGAAFGDKSGEVSGGYSRNRKVGDDNHKTGVDAGLDWDENKKGAKFGVNHEKEGPGGKSGASGGGSAHLDDDGHLTDAEVEGKLSKGGKSVSLKAGYSIEAEVKPEGTKFVVEWKRKHSGSAAGSAKGVGLSGEAETTDYGTVVFESKAEALRFKKHIASRAPSAAQDPTTLTGAVSLAVGEMRGRGHSSKTGLKGEASLSGGGSIGAGIERGSSNDVTVTRISVSVFEITRSSGIMLGKSISAGNPIGGASHKDISSHGELVTIRTDLTTPDGQAAFERFVKTGELARGAELVKRRDTEQETSATGVDLLGSTNTRTGRFGKETTTDKTGVETHVMGGATEAYEGGVLDASHSTVDVQFDATQSGRGSEYTLKGSVDATSAEDSRHGLYELTGTTSWTAASGKRGKSSGAWQVELEVTPELIAQFLDKVSDEQLREISVFEGSDPRNELRAALKRAQSITGRQEAMARFFKESGFDGKAIRAMRNVLWPVKNGWSMNKDPKMIMANHTGNFEFDLTLPGDRNFRGAAGRHELQATIEKVTKGLADPAKAMSLHGEIYETLKDVQRQRTEVADPSKYGDLPDELRQSQLARLDKDLAQLTTLTEQAAMAVTAADAAQAAAANPKPGTKKAKTAPTPAHGQGSLAKLRADIGNADKGIKENRGQFDPIFEVLKEQVRRRRSSDVTLEEWRTGMKEQGALVVVANQLKDAAVAMEPSANEARSKFILAIGSDVTTAETVGSVALVQLTQLDSLWTGASAKLTDALAKTAGVTEL